MKPIEIIERKREWKLIQACVFDVGNTLIHGSRLMAAALHELADWLVKQRFLEDPCVFIQTYNHFNRTLHQPHWSHAFGEVELFHRTFATLGIHDITPEVALQEYRARFSANTQPDPDVINAFAYLRDCGIKIALCSDERVACVDMFLRQTSIEDLVDVVVVSEELGVEKPHPTIFHEVGTRLGIPLSKMVMFGDNPVTDGGGQRLGMRFVLVTAYRDASWAWSAGEAMKPDYVIERVTRDDVAQCLEALNSNERKDA